MTSVGTRRGKYPFQAMRDVYIYKLARFRRQTPKRHDFLDHVALRISALVKKERDAGSDRVLCALSAALGHPAALELVGSAGRRGELGRARRTRFGCLKSAGTLPRFQSPSSRNGGLNLLRYRDPKSHWPVPSGAHQTRDPSSQDLERVAVRGGGGPVGAAPGDRPRAGWPLHVRGGRRRGQERAGGAAARDRSRAQPGAPGDRSCERIPSHR